MPAKTNTALFARRPLKPSGSAASCVPQAGRGRAVPRAAAGLLSLAVVAVVAIVAVTPTALAQTPPAGVAIEEVVVTAELRKTPLLEQPSSTSVVSGEAARRRNAVHLENLLQLTPNVNVSGGSSRARFYQIRGIGERSQFVEPLNPSVGLLIDDIDFSGLGTAATLYDIEQVEVLRGPQGTLHGANALAGLIAMRSAVPEDSFGAQVNATFGNYGREELGARITGPLIEDKLLYRLSAFRHRSDGFIDNAFLGRDDTNKRDESTVRGRLRWLGDAGQQMDVTVIHADVDNGYDAFSLDNTRSTLSDQPGRDRQQSNALGLNYTLAGDAIKTEILASAADSSSEYSYDEDWSFVGIAPDLEYSSFDRYLRDRRSYSAQLRLSGAEPVNVAAGSVDWVAGIYGLNDDEDLQRQYTFLSEDFGSRFEASTLAVYGEVNVGFRDAWDLTVGLRAARREMDYSDTEGVITEPANDLWGGKLALSYSSESRGMVYAALSRGYRAGGVNAGILAFPDDGSLEDTLAPLRFFDTETLYNLELGHKGAFLDGRLLSAVTLFYMDRSDQQVGGSLVISRGDGSTAFVDFTDNAAEGYNLGLEGELRFAATDSLQLYANLGLLEARFEDYVNADGRDLDGRDQAHAPSYQFATGIAYRLLPALLIDVQFEGRDAFFFSDRHDTRSTAFELLHMRIAWQQPTWEVALWGRNLTDEDYFIRGFGSFGNDPRKGYVVEDYLQYGEPLQVGASLELRF